MHGCARGPPPEGRWGGRSNPPLHVEKRRNVCFSEKNALPKTYPYL